MLVNRGLPRILIYMVLAVLALGSIGCEAGVLSARQAQYKLDGSEVALLKDPTGRLSVDDLEHPDVAKRFVQQNTPPLLGYAKEVVWLRLHLQRQEDAPQTWLLQFSNPFVNDLRLYSRTASGFSAAQAGDQFAFAQRALKFRLPVFALAFPDAGVQTFYLRLESDSSLAGELLVWQPDALRGQAQEELFFFGCVLGMIFMSFLISLIHGLHSRERTLLLFSLLTLSTFSMVAAGLGLVAQFLTPTFPTVADLLVPWSLAINTVLTTLVFGSALTIRADFPRLSRLFLLAYGVVLAAPLTRWFDLYNVWGGPLLQLISLLLMCATGWLAWLRWRAGVQGAGYYVAAQAVVIGSLVMGRLILLGWIPANTFTQMGWIPGLSVYIFLVHAGIFVDSQSVRKERDAARAEIQTAKEVLASERSLREEQTVFFSFVVHELRSPLAAIMTGLKNLEKEWTDVPQAARDRARRLKTYAEKMASLMDRHLTLQRLGNADFSPQFSPADPRQLAQECVRRVQLLFATRVFTLECAQDVPQAVSMDPDLLHMGLENLLINAAKFSPDGAAVALDMAVDTALHFRVSDRGPGIPSDQQERLFTLFVRKQQADFSSGFGIGLAIARHIAQVHGGSLAYADRAGGGAVFTLTLPLAQEGRHSA